MMQNKETKREYYFTDEDNAYIKLINMITNIVGDYVLIDFLVCILVIPAIMVGMAAGNDVFSMNGTDAIFYMKILGVYAVVAFILSIFIDKLVHKKVYVREGNTFYIIRSSVAIDNHTKLRPSKSADDPVGYADPYDVYKGDTNAYIHSRYEVAIEDLDRLIDKRSKRVKVITNCIVENEVKNGIKYSGLNEETMETEEFIFPSSYYLKYDANRNYYSEDPNALTIIWFVKCLFYFVILLFVCRIASNNAKMEAQAKAQFVQEKLETLSPLGLEYNDIVNNYSSKIVFIEQRNHYFYDEVSYSIIINDYSDVVVDWINVDYDMDYEEGTDEIYNLITTALGGDNIEKSILEAKIDKYKRTRIQEDTEYFDGKNGTIYVTISNSIYGDYHLSVMQKIRSK